MSTIPHSPPVDADGLEIAEVTRELGERVHGHFSARDRAGGRLEISGWAFGTELAATEVVVIADGVLAGRAAIAIERPDVAEKFPAEQAAASSGFRLEMVAEGSGHSLLEIFAVLEDESREPLGRVLVRGDDGGARDGQPRS